MECTDGDIKSDRVYWNALMVINKIVFTSPEARVEFSGEKIKPRHWPKPFEPIQIIIYSSEGSVIRPFLLRAR